jgi:ATP-dependent DNA ligase
MVIKRSKRPQVRGAYLAVLCTRRSYAFGESAVIDGEAVYCDDAGIAIFEKLHSRAHVVQVFLYGLLGLDGEDRRSRPLSDWLHREAHGA